MRSRARRKRRSSVGARLRLHARPSGTLIAARLRADPAHRLGNEWVWTASASDERRDATPRATTESFAVMGRFVSAERPAPLRAAHFLHGMITLESGARSAHTRACALPRDEREILGYSQASLLGVARHRAGPAIGADEDPQGLGSCAARPPSASGSLLARVAEVVIAPTGQISAPQRGRARRRALRATAKAESSQRKVVTCRRR